MSHFTSENPSEESAAGRVDLLDPFPVRNRSLREQVTEKLRYAIVFGEFAPGDRLTEESISERLEVSRGPVREALRELEQEGLVNSFPHRGSVVATITSREVTDVLNPVRYVLEQHAFCNAVGTLAPRDFAHLEQVVDQMETAAREGDVISLVRLDVEFHRFVMQTLGEVHTLQLWDLISPRLQRFFYQAAPLHPSLEELAAEHAVLIEVLRVGHADLVAKALHDHIISGPEALVSGIREDDNVPLSSALERDVRQDSGVGD